MRCNDMKVLNDADVWDYVKMYWAFVQFNEHGNEPALSEVLGAILDDLTYQYDDRQTDYLIENKAWDILKARELVQNKYEVHD